MTTHLKSKFSATKVARFLLATLCIFALGPVSGVTPIVQAASAPNIITYQGRLLNANGIPLSSASVSMIFEFYTASSGGSCVWSNSSATCASATARTVTLTDGLFSENLGDTAAATPYAAISDAIFADNAALFLQVTVAGEVLSPRKQIVAAPYALNSETLDGLDADNDGATAAAIVAYNSSGNLVVTGNPSGSGVSAGSLYINPAAVDSAANDTIFGVADGGTSIFRVDKEGDIVATGDLAINGDDITSDGTLTIDSSGVVQLGTNDDLSLSGDLDITLATSGVGAENLTIDHTHAVDSSISVISLNSTNTAAADTGTVILLNIDNEDDGGATGTPDALLGLRHLDTNEAVATGILFDVAAGALTAAIDASDAEIVTALSVGANDLAGTTGNIDYTNFDVLGASGNITSAGDLALNGGDFTSTSATFNFLDAAANSTTLDIGGVTTDLGNTINIATNVTTADVITIGNSNAASTIAITGGDDWSITTAGVATVSDLVCTDCLDFDSFEDALDLDASTSIALDGAETFTVTNGSSANTVVNLTSTGDFVVQDGGATFFTFKDDATLDFTNTTATSGEVFMLDATALTTGNLLDIDTNALTSGSIANIRSSSAWSDNMFQFTASGAATGNIVEMFSSSATATAQALFIDFDNGNTNNDVFTLITDETTNSGTAADTTKARITASGEFLSDVGFTAGGASTRYRDGSIATSSVATFDFQDAAGASTTLDFGGVTTDLGNTVNIATNSTTADVLTVGNSNAATTVAITGGDDWSITGAGLATFGGDLTANDNVNFNFTTDGAQSENLAITVTHATDVSMTPLTMLMTDTAAADTGANYFIALHNANDGGATGTPDGFIILESADTNEIVANGITFGIDPGASLTTAFNASDDEIGTALSVGANEILGTTGTLNFDNFDVSSAGAITVAAGVGLDTNAGGALTLGDTNATSVSLCNSASCDTLTLGTNADADTITIGDALDNVSLADANWSISAAGAASFGTLAINDDVDFTFVTDGAASENFNIDVTHGTDVSLNAFVVAFTDTAAADTGSNNIMIIQNANDGGGTGVPDSLAVFTNSDTNELMVDGIIVQASAGGITDGIDVSDAELTNALNIGDNIFLGTTANIDFTNFDVVGSSGDVTTTGDLALNGGDFTSTSATFNLLDASGNSTTLDIGGVTTDLGNTINVATNSTTADTLTIGNSNAGTVITITGGNDWSIGATGAASLDAITTDGTLTLSGVSNDITTGTNETLFLVPNGSGDVVVNADSNSNLQVVAAASPGTNNDLLAITNSGFASFNSFDGLDIVLEAVGTAVSGQVANAINVSSLTPSGDGGDTFRALNIANITATGSDENAIEIGTGWDSDLVFADTSPTIEIAGTGTLSVTDGTNTLLSLADSGTSGTLSVSVINLANSGTASSIFVDPSGNTGSTVSSTLGGAVHIDNTGNIDFGLTVYTNLGATANQPIAHVFQDNTAFDVNVMSIRNDSTAATSSSLVITQDVVADATTAATSQALVINVNEAQNGDEVILIVSDADGTPDAEFRFENDGDIFGDGATYNAGADYAEFFRSNDPTLQDSYVVCRDRLNANSVKRCEAGNRDVVGVVSPNPGFVGNNIPGADGSLEDNPNYRIVGLQGQISTYTSAADGPINIGDAVTASSFVPGYAGRANGPSSIIGFALESISAGQGLIKIHVSPQWYAGQVLSTDGQVALLMDEVALTAVAQATAANPLQDSNALTFRGSAWDGSSAQTVTMGLVNKVIGPADSRLAVTNNAGVEVGAITQTGDFVLSGKFYPSGNGITQTNAYIFYDPTGVGYMRTNAAGWGTGSYDFAEMFPSKETLKPGELVVFGDGQEQVKKSGDEPYSDRIAGVISTRPGFLAGENRVGDYPVALAGRVPTFVTNENGSVAVGDPLTTSTRPGYAMKATEPGPILGYAMAEMTSNEGKIVAFIRPSYFDGNGSIAETPMAENIVSNLSSNVSNLNISGSLAMNGGSILGVSSIVAGNGLWKISENGDLETQGRLIQIVNSFQNERVETYAVASRETTVQLSGTATLVNGLVNVSFEQIDPKFNDVISPGSSYRVLVTPSGITGQIYVTDRSNGGFTIHAEGGASGVLVDWLVIAYHKDFEPLAQEPTEVQEAQDVLVTEVIPTDSETVQNETELTTNEPELVTSESQSATSEPNVTTPDPELTAPLETGEALTNSIQSESSETNTAVAL